MRFVRPWSSLLVRIDETGGLKSAGKPVSGTSPSWIRLLP
jgi:hypothetical protein